MSWSLGFRLIATPHAVRLAIGGQSHGKARNDSGNKKLVDKIINNVNDILKVRNKNSSEDVSKIEKEIDKLTYKLYNLSNEEIEIIEES